MSIERIVLIDLVWRFDYFDMSLIHYDIATAYIKSRG